MKKIIINFLPLLLLTSCSYLSTNNLNPQQKQNGKLIPVPVEKTEVKTTILTVGTVNKDRVTTKVLEENISQINLGKKVVISAKNNPQKSLSGEVTNIASEATEIDNLKSFTVEITLAAEASDRLENNENVIVDFLVEESKNIIVIPTAAIDQQDDTTGVLVGTPNKPPQFVPITVGISHGEIAKNEILRNRTEVKSGLDGTEHILVEASRLPPHMRKKEGGLRKEG